MANFEIDNSELVRAVLLQTGLGRDPAEMDEATEADVRSILRSGLRRFFFPLQDGFTYQWRFLETPFTISAEAVFDEGTIEVSGGVVTLTGDTWPADIIDHYIEVSGHILFVTERTSDTLLEVSHSQLTVAAGTSYEAPRYRYPLPSDFGEFLGGVVYQNESDNWMLIGSSEPELRLRYAIGYELANETTHWAVFDGKLYLWPTPIPDAFIQSIYVAVPTDNLPADLTVPGSTVQVTALYAEAAKAAVLAAAELYLDDKAGIHEQRFQAALAAAINHDRAVGGHYDFSRQVGPDYRGLGPVSNIDFSDALL